MLARRCLSTSVDAVVQLHHQDHASTEYLTNNHSPFWRKGQSTPGRGCEIESGCPREKRGCNKRREQQVHANASARLKRSERGRPRLPITQRKGEACYNRSIGWCLASVSEVGLYTWSSLLSAYAGENKDRCKNEKECQQVSVTTKTELKD